MLAFGEYWPPYFEVAESKTRRGVCVAVVRTPDGSYRREFRSCEQATDALRCLKEALVRHQGPVGPTVRRWGRSEICRP